MPAKKKKGGPVRKEARLLVVICWNEPSQSKRYPDEPALSLLGACPLSTRTFRLPQKKDLPRHEDTWTPPEDSRPGLMHVI